MTFDVWHTLVALSPSVEEEYFEAQLELGRRALEKARLGPGAPHLRPSDLRREFKRSIVEAVAAAAAGRAISPAEQMRAAGRRTRRTPSLPAYLRDLAALARAQPFRLAPGAGATLARLAARGYRMGVVSNTVGEPGSALATVLVRLGVGRYFPTMVFSDRLPWTKPSPHIFREALRRLGSTPGVTVHVGDGWADLEGARRAGLRGAVWFTGLQQYGPSYRQLFAGSGSSSPPPAAEASRFTELPSILDDLFSQPPNP